MMQQADKLQVIFISVDPNRDVGNLATFVKRFNTSFIGLSAEDEALNKLTRTLGVYHEIVQIKERVSKDHSQHPVEKGDEKMSMSMKGVKVAKKDNYLVNHTASYLLLNPNLELTGLLTNPHNAKKMAVALDLIIEALD
jgi:protein SCO1/2